MSIRRCVHTYNLNALPYEFFHFFSYFTSILSFVRAPEQSGLAARGASFIASSRGKGAGVQTAPVLEYPIC